MGRRSLSLSTCGLHGAGHAGWSARCWPSWLETSPAKSSSSRSTSTTTRVISQRFGVQAVPTLLVLDHGRVIAQQAGAAPTQILRRWVERRPGPCRSERAMSTVGGPAPEPGATGATAHPARMRGMLADRFTLAAPAAVPHLRARGLLRFLPDAACSRARRPHRPPHRAILRAGRVVAVVLCRRDLRLKAGRRTIPSRLPPETPDLHGAYPRLSAAEIETLSAHGERRFVDPGEVLLREGEPSTYFYVLLKGRAGVFEDYDGRRRLIRVHGPRRFLGELSILTGQVESSPPRP